MDRVNSELRSLVGRGRGRGRSRGGSAAVRDVTRSHRHSSMEVRMAAQRRALYAATNYDSSEVRFFF
jgi:hypothetical protein